MKKVSTRQVVTAKKAQDVSLRAEIPGSARRARRGSEAGLLALTVGLGLRVVQELMEREVDRVVGPKGKWKPDRT